MVRPREKEILDCKQKYILWAALQNMSAVHKYLEITRIVVIINKPDSVPLCVPLCHRTSQSACVLCHPLFGHASGLRIIAGTPPQPEQGPSLLLLAYSSSSLVQVLQEGIVVVPWACWPKNESRPVLEQEILFYTRLFFRCLELIEM